MPTCDQHPVAKEKILPLRPTDEMLKWISEHNGVTPGVSFERWCAGLDDGMLKDVLGADRADAFRRGELTGADLLADPAARRGTVPAPHEVFPVTPKPPAPPPPPEPSEEPVDVAPPASARPLEHGQCPSCRVRYAHKVGCIRDPFRDTAP